MKLAPVGPLIAALALLAGTLDVDAQVRRGRQAEAPGRWAPLAIGVRGGWDQRANGEVLGAQLRVPFVRSGILELVPSADVAFLTGAKDYQYSIDVAWAPAGARGGVFVTGGIGWRDSAVVSSESGASRTTYFGYGLGAGAKAGVGPVEFEVALRWTFLNDTDYRPNQATAGVNYPFWSIEPRGGP